MNKKIPPPPKWRIKWEIKNNPSWYLNDNEGTMGWWCWKYMRDGWISNALAQYKDKPKT